MATRAVPVARHFPKDLLGISPVSLFVVRQTLTLTGKSPVSAAQRKTASAVTLLTLTAACTPSSAWDLVN